MKHLAGRWMRPYVDEQPEISSMRGFITPMIVTILAPLQFNK